MIEFSAPCMGCTAEVLVLIDFEGTMGDELTMTAGDIVKNVTTSNEEGWLEGELGEKRGMFPANFVQVCKRKAAHSSSCHHLLIYELSSFMQVKNIPFCFVVFFHYRKCQSA